MKKADELLALPDWIQWLLIGGAFAISLLSLLYYNKSTDLASTERFSRYQSFLQECRCFPSGKTYTPDGIEEEELTCAKGGGTVSFSNYAEVTDDFYDPRNQIPTRLCPQ